MKKFSLFLTLISFAWLGPSVLASPPGSGYHLLKKVSLGAAPGGGEYFDYVTVDSDARRVYLSHGAEVKVLDADNFSVVGTLSGLKRCHGIVVLPEIGKGFITDGDAAQVVVFDLKSLKKTAEIKTPPDTDSIFYDPASKLIFTFNGDSKNASVIDPVKETVVKTIDLDGGVEQAVADGKGTIYDNNEEKNDVAVIDTKTLTVKARCPCRIACGHGHGPRAPAAIFERPRSRLFGDDGCGQWQGPPVVAHQFRGGRQRLRPR